MNDAQTPGSNPGRGFLLQVYANAGLLGVAAMLTQAVLAREALSTATGHELMLGVALTGWLLGQAICLALVWKAGSHINAFVGLSIAALLAPLSFFSIRVAANTITPVDGTLPSLVDIAPWVLLSLLPASLGFALAFAAIYHQARKVTGKHALVLVYGAETLGFLLGGVLWTFALAGQVSHLLTMLAVAVTLVCITAVLAGRQALPYAVAAGVMAIAAFVGYPWLSDALRPVLPDGVAQLKHLDGKHARWQVGEYGGEYSFYCDGRLFASTGQSAIAGESILLPLAQLPAHVTSPRVLAIGPRYPGVEQELGADLLASVVWLENDGQYTQLYREYATPDSTARIVTGPPVSWVERGPWDLILLNLGAPSGTGVAWAYSPGFLELCQANLAPSGVLALSLDAEENYNSAALLAVHSRVRSNLDSAFDQLAISPPVPVWYFAGGSKAILSLDAVELAGRLTARGINAPYMHKFVLEDRLAPERAKAWGANQPAGSTPPSLTLAGLRAELLGDDPRISNALGWLSDNSLPLGLSLCGLLLIPLAFTSVNRVKQTTNRPFQPESRSLATAFWCGFSCLGLEIVLAWELQALTGNLYLYLALLTAAVLCGLFLGISTTGRLMQLPVAKRMLISNTLALVLALLIALIPWAFKIAGYSPGIGIVWFAALVVPLLIGSILGLALADESIHPGLIYGMDMLGAALAALLVGSIGMLVWGSLWCSAVIASGWAILWLTGGKPGHLLR